MLMRLEPASGRPVYQQIVDQIKHQVAMGVQQAGDRLPTVRELAEQLIVNPNTVAHAYQQLERDNVIETRRGLGSFIREASSPLSPDVRRKMVADLIDRALVEAHHVNVTADQVRAILEERLATFGPVEVNYK